MTDGKRAAGGWRLVNLVDPPPPPDVYGAWKGGWVDFDGSSVLIGSAHGDPGRFAAGQGPVTRGRFGLIRRVPVPDRRHGSGVRQLRPQTAVRYSDAGSTRSIARGSLRRRRRREQFDC